MPKIPEQDNFLQIVKDLQQRVYELETRQYNDDLVLPADKKIYLDGTDKSVYIVWNSTSSQLEFYVNSTLEGFVSSACTGTRLANV